MFGNHALVATEDPDAKTHGMWLLDVNALSKKTQGKPLIIAQAQPLEVQLLSF
jgi:hypothetical protein